MSIVLNSVDKSLEMVLDSAVETNQITYFVSYADRTSDSFLPSSSDGTSNDTTNVTMVSAPSASTQRLVNIINVYNSDTDEVTVSVILNNNSVYRIIGKFTLSIGNTLQYADGRWHMINEEGNVKSVGETGAQGYQGYQGYQGTQGYQGAQGVRGYQGYQGDDGAQGPQGYQGDGADNYLQLATMGWMQL